MSAAAHITIFLLFIVLAPILVVGAGFVGWLYWRERAERQRLETTARQAEIYGQLSSPPTLRPRPHPRSPAPPGGNIFVFPRNGIVPYGPMPYDTAPGGDQGPVGDGEWRVIR
jgi:hypothetical protein